MPDRELVFRTVQVGQQFRYVCGGRPVAYVGDRDVNHQTRVRHAARLPFATAPLTWVRNRLSPAP